MSAVQSLSLFLFASVAWLFPPTISLPLNDPQPAAVRIRDRIQVEGSMTGGLLLQVPIKCDAKGSLFFRSYDPKNMDTAPITRVSPDGKETRVISVHSAPGFEKGTAFDFDVTPRGDVFLLAGKVEGEREILRFSADGKFASQFKLQRNIDPMQIAVFPSGELLVFGSELPEVVPGKQGRPLAAVYDPSGRFVLELSLPRDVSPPPENGSPSEGAGSGISISGSVVVPADDGNIYILRKTPQAAVYAVSPAGLVLRRILIPAPSEKFRPVTIAVAGGRILVEFAAEKTTGVGSQFIYRIADAESGAVLGDYEMPPGAGGIFSCYQSAGLTFLTTRDQRLEIIKASVF